MAKGTIVADFAGTYDEAVEFAATHGFKAPKGFCRHGAQGLPMISYPFANGIQMVAGIALFAQHGWDRDSILIR